MCILYQVRFTINHFVKVKTFQDLCNHINHQEFKKLFSFPISMYGSACGVVQPGKSYFCDRDKQNFPHGTNGIFFVFLKYNILGLWPELALKSYRFLKNNGQAHSFTPAVLK